MNRHVVAIGALLVLGGCGGGGDEAGGKGQSGSSPGGAASAASMQPGQWEVTTQMVSMNVPGAPASAIAQQAPPNTSLRCIKATDADELAKSFAEANPEQCPTREFSMSGGRMNGQITCSQDGKESSTTLTGDYTAKSFDMRIEQKTPSAPGQVVTAVMRSTGRWIKDECPAEEGDDSAG